jgi:hypothetical protein
MIMNLSNVVDKKLLIQELTRRARELDELADGESSTASLSLYGKAAGLYMVTIYLHTGKWPEEEEK